MEFIIDGEGSRGVIVFAHGSSIAMDHQYMQDITEKLVGVGLKVVRFEFPYMASRRVTGKKGFPNQLPVLITAFRDVITQVRKTVLKPSQPLYLAGKSLGGRVASHLYIEGGFEGLFVFGYPFHPAKNDKVLRIAHLFETTADINIFQGERDKLGNKEEVESYRLNKNILIHWLADADHDLVPRVRSGFSKEQHANHVINKIEQLIS
jgi:predicted alpha/beta-hydrolase family hydrolase